MYLGIDIGASFCKAVVIDHNLNVLYSTRKEMPNSIDTGSVKVVEYDINEILNLIYDLIKSINKQFLMQIDGIGVSGQMHGILLLDKSNNPVTNFISWQDQRATELLSESQETYLNFLKDNLQNYTNLTGTDLRSGMMGSLLFWFKRKDFFSNNTEIKATFISDYLVSVLTEYVMLPSFPKICRLSFK